MILIIFSAFIFILTISFCASPTPQAPEGYRKVNVGNGSGSCVAKRPNCYAAGLQDLGSYGCRRKLATVFRATIQSWLESFHGTLPIHRGFIFIFHKWVWAENLEINWFFVLLYFVLFHSLQPSSADYGRNHSVLLQLQFQALWLYGGLQVRI